MPRRFRKTWKQSFFGDFVYAQAVPADHFLAQMDRTVAWDQFTPVLLEAYKGQGKVGAVPYEPVMILKMLLLSYLYDISERQTEEFCNYYLPAKAFVGLGITDRAPDHSTLTVFKVRLLNHKAGEIYGTLFDAIIKQAQAAGVRFGAIQVVDAVHTVANVNTEKDRKRIEDGKPSADPDASVVNKGTRAITKADGTIQDEQVKYLGYKTHVSMDAETGLVTSIIPTRGDSADNKQMPGLVDHDATLGVPAETYTADRAYDDGDLHELLWTRHKHSALRLKAQRTTKKDDSKALWFKLLASPFYQAGLAVRYRIERKFGEAKAWHGFDRCRYRGVARYRVQSYLTFMVLNLKRLILLVTGTRFRPLAKHLVDG